VCYVPYMRICEAFKDWRKARKLSLRDLSSEIGLNISCLSRMERGKPIEGAALGKLLRWMLEAPRA
jgi:transcriptional regulator with XRE-family HTH domain